VLEDRTVETAKTPIFTPQNRYLVEELPEDDRVGQFVVSDYSEQASSKEMRAFVGEYKKLFGDKEPDRHAAICYDSLLYVFRAAEKQDSKMSLKGSLLKTEEFGGVMGLRRNSKKFGIKRNVYFSRTQKKGFRLMEIFAVD
jgi:ABC-type branched-subunit amino acid transport system substrate-binding protein